MVYRVRRIVNGNSARYEYFNRYLDAIAAAQHEAWRGRQSVAVEQGMSASSPVFDAILAVKPNGRQTFP